MAGILKHIKAITAIANPLINSYKRLSSEQEAPSYITWSPHNVNSLIRIPTVSHSSSYRIELRSPDPTANPYLTIALVLAAGLEGISEKMTLPPAFDIPVHTLTRTEFKRKKIEPLPRDLYIALEEMKKDSLVRSILGEHIFSKYVEAKEQEWDSYKNSVSQWEVENYLAKY
nr:glutamine synthetase [Brucepastera parasyntrophica]